LLSKSEVECKGSSLLHVDSHSSLLVIEAH
jgi:hypothetical protein